MSVTTIPTAPGGMFRQQGHGLLVAFDSLLKAIENKVFVPAADIGVDQRREISRELWCMRQQLDEAFAAAGLAKFAGSFHLMREPDGDDGDDDPQAAA